MPLAIVAAVVLASQGVVQNLNGNVEATTLEGAAQVIPGGPSASQEVMKTLGTNGGGLYNANSTHPFENPNGLEQCALAAPRGGHPVRLRPHVRTDGRRSSAGAHAAGDHGGRLAATDHRRCRCRSRRQRPAGPPPASSKLLTLQRAATWRARTYGSARPALPRWRSAPWARRPASPAPRSTATHRSVGWPPSAPILLGEISPGGVGSGLYAMLIYVLAAVFIGGLMVGRTPELLGKMVGAAEIRLVTLYLLTLPVVILAGAAAAAVLPDRAHVPAQRRAARLHRDLLCLCLGRQWERLCVRRAERQHGLVQHDARDRHARRAVTS